MMATFRVERPGAVRASSAAPLHHLDGVSLAVIDKAVRCRQRESFL
jgi:hypothetical protein